MRPSFFLYAILLALPLLSPLRAADSAAALPAEAAPGADWFVVASDDRPVTVSSDLMHLAPRGPAGN